MRTPARTYDTASIILHWVVGTGILLLAGTELLRHEFPRGHFLREGLKSIHQPLGTLLFGLILLRLMWRVALARVPADTTHSGLARLAAGGMHVLLYGLMVAIPLLGLGAVLGTDKSVDFFGLFQLVLPLKAQLGSLAKGMRGMHETLGIAILVIALLHAIAALGHHYILRDGLMARMRPGRAPKPALVAAE